jgi:hypothetical protein
VHADTLSQCSFPPLRQKTRNVTARTHRSHVGVVAFVSGSKGPVEGVYGDPEPWGGNQVFGVYLSDWRDFDDDHPGGLSCGDCLIEQFPELERGFELAAEHGGSWRIVGGEWLQTADD